MSIETMEGGFTPESEIKLPLTESREIDNGFKGEFYVTDHRPDYPEVTEDDLRVHYKDIKRDGIDSIRFDFRWSLVEGQKGQINQDQLKKYADAAKIMREVGLKEPTIILSSLPSWAKELYKTNKEEFFTKFGEFATNVRDSVRLAGGKPETVQVLNELNNPAYTPITDLQDIGRLCDIAKKVFGEDNPNTKIMISVMAATLPDATNKAGFSENIRTFLPKLKEIKDKFDILGIDYYPGGWQRPISEGNKLKNLFKRVLFPQKDEYKKMFADMSLFEEVAQEAATWGVDYELGEAGFPSKGIYWGDERRQRYFYDAFSRSFRHMLNGFQERGIKLPIRIGFYQARNEPPRNLIGEVMRKTPYPEFDWGMRDDEGERKLILQGKLHNPTQGESRLSEIIRYLKIPMATKKARDLSA